MTGNLRWHSCSNKDFPLKRTKVSRACENCRSKKIKCDGLNPCQRCENNNIVCEYTEKSSRKRFKKEPSPTPSIQYTIDNTAFKNELYQLSNKSNSSLLPLLFDFFNTTSQPMHIWNTMIKIHDQQRTDSLLFQEAFHLFMSHNTLYSAFIDSQLISACITTFMQKPAHLPPTTILAYSILSVTFYSAYQSLPTNDSLYTYAHLFYKKAHKAFIESCFPTQAEFHHQQETIHLVQSAVLLAHFQCQAIHESQAYMTIRLGLDLAQRYALVQLASKHKKLAVFLKVLDAWHVWLSLYLDKPYFTRELELPELDTSAIIELSKEQAWAIKTTDVYTEILRKILLKQLTTMTSIKENLKFASDISKIDMYSKKSPSKTIQLYHHTLTIQLLTSQFHQLMDHCAELDSTSSLSSQQSTEKDLPKEDIAIIETCVQSSQNILTSVNTTLFLPVLYSLCQVSLLCTHQKSAQLSIYNQLMTVLKNGAHLEPYQFLYNKLTADVFVNNLISMGQDILYYPMKNDDLYWMQRLPQPKPTTEPGSTIFFASEVQTLHLSTESFLDSMDNVFTRPG